MLQTAMCLGLARPCLINARASLAGVASVFITEVEAMAGKLALINAAMTKTAHSVGGPIPPTRAELLAMRLTAADVATGAAALEAKTAGGKGYISSSGMSRRYREAAFIRAIPLRVTASLGAGLMRAVIGEQTPSGSRC
ncbi:hypothetical protein [Actinacidiphila soli]|uniref:hypothetical protein n=1 Tax=Actinacidiphila soli TaxID=2487275 RepID=UPI000FCC25FF|nr:hypothetical protein [Actinacidiphila soli]